MRRFARPLLTKRVLFVRALLLLLLVFACALMGWLFYAQPTGPGANGDSTPAVGLPTETAPMSGPGQRSKQ
jgi:hypothetical protein